MKLDISTKNIRLDNPIRVFIHSKMEDLEHLLGTAAFLANVEVGKQSQHHKTGPIFYAEANVHVGGKLLRAQAEHVDLRAAIVDVKEGLKIQIKKFKEKPKSVTRKRK